MLKSTPDATGKLRHRLGKGLSWFLSWDLGLSLVWVGRTSNAVLCPRRWSPAATWTLCPGNIITVLSLQMADLCPRRSPSTGEGTGQSASKHHLALRAALTSLPEAIRHPYKRFLSQETSLEWPLGQAKCPLGCPPLDFPLGFGPGPGFTGPADILAVPSHVLSPLPPTPFPT